MIEFGQPKEEKDITANDPMLVLYEACLSNPDFSVIDIREHEKYGTVLIVDCINTEIPSAKEIRNKERLALYYNPQSSNKHHVRVLRDDFPRTIHQYLGICVGELCLYHDTWNTRKRTWTPEFHLNRIKWWLKTASEGKLAINDPLLEPVYVTGSKKLILANSFFTEKEDTYYRLDEVNPNLFKMEVGNECDHIDVLHFEVSNVAHGIIHGVTTLIGFFGSMYDVSDNMASIFLNTLRDKLSKYGTSNENTKLTIIIITVPAIREAGELNYTSNYAFILKISAKELLQKIELAVEPSGDSMDSFSVLEAVELEAIQLLEKPSIGQIRLYSGINEHNAEFNGIVIGLGSLGSNIVSIWSKETWGKWTLIDNDYIKPHNIARHIAKSYNIGKSKVSVVQFDHYSNYEYEDSLYRTFEESFHEDRVKEYVTGLDIRVFIDISTSNDVPRSLSSIELPSRCISTFLSPSGENSVLLVEDSNRKIRLDSLECQYYRAVINARWGNEFLSTKNKPVYGGCRDITAIIPQDLISIHSAIISRAIRLELDDLNARISIFMLDNSCNVHRHEIPVSSCSVYQANEWSVIIDDGVIVKIKKYRNKYYPNETGGIVLGYHDQYTKKIYVVDVSDEPRDSISNRTSFIRGVSGLQNKLNDVIERTKGEVNYIGEWHSHPNMCSTKPSADDQIIIHQLKDELRCEGIPFLMIISNGEDMDIIVR